MSGEGCLQRLSEHVAACRYENLPSEVVAAGKRLLIDTLAVGWAGSASEGLGTIRDRMVAQSGPERCDLWGTESRCAALDAAFINSASAAALEYDSLHAEALIHADIVSAPAVLAAAQSVHASGKDFLAALIVANDVSCRLALASSTHKGWWHTSVYGIFGAAAASAKVLGLGADGIANAMGIALSQASGTQQPIVERGDAKRLQSAFAARAGIFSAFLASSGVTGPRGAFDGPYGLFALYESGRSERALEGLGTRYEGSFSSIKKYPTCACNHTLTEAALQLVEEFDLQPMGIARATARISPYMDRLVGAPYEPGANPGVAAQFSAQYSVACAVFRRRVALADLQPAAAVEPAVVAFAKHVLIEVDPSNVGQLAPAEVEFALSDGTCLSRRIDVIPGSPSSPTTPLDDRRKIFDCLSRGLRPLSDRETEGLCSTIDNIDGLPDVARLFDEIRGGSR